MNEISTIKATNELIIFGDPNIGDQYLSFTPSSPEDKMKLFNAINSPDKRLADVINTPITIRDVIISKVKLSAKINRKDTEGFTDEEDDAPTKEEDGIRVVFLDTDGVSYTATSRGIYNSVCNLRSVFGDLHFENGLRMMVKQIKTKNGNTLSITLV